MAIYKLVLKYKNNRTGRTHDKESLCTRSGDNCDYKQGQREIKKKHLNFGINIHLYK